MKALDDYVRGRGTEAEAAAFEEDLFARAVAGAAPELAAYDALAATLRRLAGRGTLVNFVLAADLPALRAQHGDGFVFIEQGPPGEVFRVVLPQEMEVLASRVPVDLRGVERVDMEIETLDGRPLKRMPDVGFERGGDALYTCCERELAHATVGFPFRTRIIGFSAGSPRVLSEFVTECEIAV